MCLAVLFIIEKRILQRSEFFKVKAIFFTFGIRINLKYKSLFISVEYVLAVV